MNDFAVGIVSILTGLVFCFHGYLAMRIVIPIWGAFAGFFLGAGLASADSGFLGTTLSWIAGLALAVVFGLIAYFFYEVAVVLGMMAIGFVLGTTLIAAFGVTWSWAIVLTGLVFGIVLAVIAVVGSVPMLLLTALTALAGASATVSGLMLLFNVYDTGDYSSAVTTKAAADDWWWYVIYGALVIAGAILSSAMSSGATRHSARPGLQHEFDDGVTIRFPPPRRTRPTTQRC